MSTENKMIIFYITENGSKLAERLNVLFAEAQVLRFKADAVAGVWPQARCLIFIMATGIVVRTIASLIKDKRTDPAVVVLDEKGKFAISLLSGHIGGANKIAKDIADFLGSSAVITTASDVHNIPPRKLVLGIGCNRGTSAKEIEKAVRKTLAEHNLSFAGVVSVATIDKKGEEPGLVAFAQDYRLKVQTFTPAELNSVEGIWKSESVFKAIGAIGVAEPAALLASGVNKLLVPKQKVGNVTVAVAEQNSEFRIQNSEVRREKKGEKGKIYIVGIGPGNVEHITPYAQEVIRSAEVIVGYQTYLDLISGLIEGKEVITTGMTQEIERCTKAVELAMDGRTVAVISGGDPGIYAMAGLVFEILKGYQSPDTIAPVSDYRLPITDYQLLKVEVIPGISALNACAARLGAPLMHDFAVISLSDRLTPWELIEKRIESAAVADFVIVLYNPKSRGRQRQIDRAKKIIAKYRAPETPVGIVKGAMRNNETTVVTNLKNMLDEKIDMQTTIIIGNLQTFTWNNWMITPRGYEMKVKNDLCNRSGV